MELSAHNMQKYIGGPVMVKTMLHMLQDDMEKGFRTIYPETMEARVALIKTSPNNMGTR